MQIFAETPRDLRADLSGTFAEPAVGNGSLGFRVFKRMVDVCLALQALPVIAGVALVLVMVNPFFNPGPVFFRQDRMGRNGRPFKVIKFRSMKPSQSNLRGHDEPLEIDRITPLGAIMRRYRIDELPNFLNVMKGEMSVVGPRPDAFDHARIYAARIPRYGVRYRARPGITGLAQVRGGYADCTRSVLRKAHYDYFYIRRPSIRLELYIIGETFRVIANGFGAK